MKNIVSIHKPIQSGGKFGTPDPIEVCNLIADGIPVEILKSDKLILDVGIGCGGISRAIVKRMVNKLYINHYDAILRIHGVDNDLALVKGAKLNGFINTQLADFSTWQPDMYFAAIVGNPPYSDTENVKGATLGGCSKGLDDKFFLKSMEMSPFVSLIIRSKYFAKKSSKFRRKLFSSGHIESMVALPASVFPTIGLTETVVVTYNVNHTGPTKVTFQGGEVKEILLTEETCIKFTNSNYVPDLEGNLASRHSMGSVGLNQMKDGDCPMVLTLNSRKADIKIKLVSSDQHVHGLNEHGVLMNRVYGGYGLGKVFVKPYDHSISRCAIMLKTNSEEESKILCEYLRTPEVQELANANKISNVLSKELFKTIRDPLI